MEKFEGEAILKGQAEIYEYMFNFADSMVLRCAVELRIPNIINNHSRPITLAQIASEIESSATPDISCLARVMRLLVRRKIFTIQSTNGGDLVYGLTPASMWLLQGTEMSLAPLLLMQTHPWLMSPWRQLSACVREGGDVPAFQKEQGLPIWEFGSTNPDFNRLFNDAMECSTKIATEAIISGYKEGFKGIKSLVDVGGGTGRMMAEIVKAYPHITGTNFDQPHVVATAPEHDGVNHIGGDMFEMIPNADAFIMKWILHDWSDEDCVKILKNCRKVLNGNKGKVIIVDIVLEADGEDLFDNTRLAFDLLMIAHTSGGKERTELEWKKLLEDGGFGKYNIIKLPAIVSMIEAYAD